MNSHIILFCGLLVLWMIAIKTNGNEIGAPASIVGFMFLLTALLCIYGYGGWNTIDLSATTIAIILSGCAAFTVGSALAFHREQKERIVFHPVQQVCIGRQFPYRIDLWKLVVLMVFFLVIAYVRVVSMKRIAAAAGMNLKGIVAISKWYREAFSRLFGAGTVRSGVGETFIEKQILRFATVITNGAVVAFLIGVSQKNKKVIIGSGILLIIFAVYSIFTDGGRAGVLFKAVIIAYGLYILQIRKGTPIKSINKAFGIAAVVALMIAFPVFYYSSALVGRKAGGDMLQYLSFYFGCGIPSLELKLQQGLGNQLFGQNVLYGIHTLLYKVGLLDNLGGYANEWQNLNGYSSNVYTAWYRYYADFGIAGVILLAGLYGWFFTYLYQKVKKSESLVAWCVFCAWGHSLFDLSRDDYLYGQFIGTAPLLNLALSMILIWILCRPMAPEICFSANCVSERKAAGPEIPFRQRIVQFFHREPITFRSSQEV